MKHSSHVEMTVECSKKNISNRIAMVIQKCIACIHRGPNFSTGKLQRNKSLFNKDVFIQLGG